MLRTFKFRLYPSITHQKDLEHILADNCETYNAALQERIEAWKLLSPLEIAGRVVEAGMRRIISWQYACWQT